MENTKPKSFRMLFCRLANRLAETQSGFMMIGIALTIIIDPQTIVKGGFYLIKDIGLTPFVLTTIFLLAGTGRLLGIAANGFWPYWGPILRAIGGAVGAIVWMQMAYALIKWSTDQHYYSLGISIYSVLAFGELIAIGRSANDARRNHQ